MLEVHAPHQATHSWKDVFIHIAVIVVGLLIALGLDEMAQYVHHQREVRETREAIRREIELNRKTFAENVVLSRWETAEYENNLLVLDYMQKHPGAPPEEQPGVIDWDHGGSQYFFGEWETAQQSGITALMPPEEVTRDARMYQDIRNITERENLEGVATHQAEEFRYLEYDLSKMTPAQIADEMALTRTVLMQRYRTISAMRTLAVDFPEFGPGPPHAEMYGMLKDPDPETKKRLAHAYALTEQRKEAAGFDPGSGRR